jgi:DNA-3-methyladenine glycosylase II
MTAERAAAHATLAADREVLGPWSLATSRAFWEGFAPAAIAPNERAGELRTLFLAERDWRPVEAVVTQQGTVARVVVSGPGDLESAAGQVLRFLSLDIDAREWPDDGDRDPVIARAQEQLPGLRPCGFHSPYEAAAWAVLSQRIRIPQAAALRRTLISRYGEAGAFPAPEALHAMQVDLPGRKLEYLHAVAGAALDGVLEGTHLRSIEPAQAMREVAAIKGLGPFAAELVVIRGANAPDVMPTAERRLDAELGHLYGPGYSAEVISQRWRPFRSWAAVHLRALREIRTRGTAEGGMSYSR